MQICSFSLGKRGEMIRAKPEIWPTCPKIAEKSKMTVAEATNLASAAGKQAGRAEGPHGRGREDLSGGRPRSGK